MLKHLFFALVVAGGLTGCAAEMAATPSATPSATPDQSQAFKPSCTTEEPATGSMLRKKKCG
jgi:hypothetical protein